MGDTVLCRKGVRQQGLPLRHPRRPRRAGLSPSSAPGGVGPRLRVTRCRETDARGGQQSSDTVIPHVVLLSGESNVGKTTLIERLIPRLRKRGLRVGTVKHAHHGFEMDRPGKDSWRHQQAGAAAVALIGPSQATWLMATPKELSCGEAVTRMRDQVDLVLVEGFKKAGGRQVLLELSPSARIRVDHDRCRIGARPDELLPQEWEALVEFCVQAREPVAP